MSTAVERRLRKQISFLIEKTDDYPCASHQYGSCPYGISWPNSKCRKDKRLCWRKVINAEIK